MYMHMRVHKRNTSCFYAVAECNGAKRMEPKLLSQWKKLQMGQIVDMKWFGWQMERDLEKDQISRKSINFKYLCSCRR